MDEEETPFLFTQYDPDYDVEPTDADMWSSSEDEDYARPIPHELRSTGADADLFSPMNPQWWLAGTPHAYAPFPGNAREWESSVYDDGTTYEGLTHLDIPQGIGVIQMGNMGGGAMSGFKFGDTYSGEFDLGWAEGLGVYEAIDGRVYVGEFREGLREGCGVEYNRSDWERLVEEGMTPAQAAIEVRRNPRLLGRLRAGTWLDDTLFEEPDERGFFCTPGEIEGTTEEAFEVAARAEMFRYKPDGEATWRMHQDQDGQPIEFFQHPLHYPYGSRWMAPGPAGLATPIPESPQVVESLEASARNHMRIWKRYNFPRLVREGSELDRGAEIFHDKLRAIKAVERRVLELEKRREARGGGSRRRRGRRGSSGGLERGWRAVQGDYLEPVLRRGLFWGKRYSRWGGAYAAAYALWGAKSLAWWVSQLPHVSGWRRARAAVRDAGDVAGPRAGTKAGSLAVPGAKRRSKGAEGKSLVVARRAPSPAAEGRGKGRVEERGDGRAGGRAEPDAGPSPGAAASGGPPPRPDPSSLPLPPWERTEEELWPDVRDERFALARRHRAETGPEAGSLEELKTRGAAVWARSLLHGWRQRRQREREDRAQLRGLSRSAAAAGPREGGGEGETAPARSRNRRQRPDLTLAEGVAELELDSGERGGPGGGAGGPGTPFASFSRRRRGAAPPPSPPLASLSLRLRLPLPSAPARVPHPPAFLTGGVEVIRAPQRARR